MATLSCRDDRCARSLEICPDVAIWFSASGIAVRANVVVQSIGGHADESPDPSGYHRGMGLMAAYHSEMNLTPTERRSIHISSQSRWALRSLYSTSVNVRGISVVGWPITRRAPPLETSRIMHGTARSFPEKVTSAARRIERRSVLRPSRYEPLGIGPAIVQLHCSRSDSLGRRIARQSG